MSLAEREEYYRKMEDSLIIVSHDDLPGRLYFRGYLSVESFLLTHETVEGMLEIWMMGDTMRLPMNETEIEFKQMPPYYG